MNMANKATSKDIENKLRKQLGRRIQDLRCAQDLSQEELAHRMGIATSSLSCIEVGRSYPKPATISMIADSLGVKVHELFNFTDFESSAEVFDSIVEKLKRIKKSRNKELLVAIYQFIENVS
ncbi:hypothetical protein tpqmel_0550 [Candidatus Gastranaerophilus sp. (ex Termes propinquus)]|nr:hypothetical protein tpqmel_0550 [Candidatus Gastranaerophilus sp. (ex Termes propinquus)]